MVNTHILFQDIYHLDFTMNTLNVKIVGKNSTTHLVYISINKSYMFQGPSALILREMTTDEINFTKLNIIWILQ
jgi:hypothetical protein